LLNYRQGPHPGEPAAPLLIGGSRLQVRALLDQNGKLDTLLSRVAASSRVRTRRAAQV